MRPPEGAVLTRRTLNRTLLARQGLLEVSALPVTSAIEQVVGLQAQVPADPYLSLRARLRGFVPSALEGLVLERSALRLGLFRGTLHLVTARDALGIRPLMQEDAVRSFRSSPFARRLEGVDLDGVLRAGIDLLEERPLSLVELGAALSRRWPSADADALAYAIRILVPVVQVPPRGLWQRTGAPRITTLAGWLGGDREERTTREDVVVRYLRAFGPATIADMRTWSGLTALAATVGGMRDQLRTYRDEAGRVLVDAEDGLLADAEVPAPVRFLGEYDNVFLAHADRSRITGILRWGAAYARKRAFFVDGYLAGAWRVDTSRGAVVLTVEQAAPLSAVARDEVAAEASAVVSFVAPDQTAEIRFTQM